MKERAELFIWLVSKGLLVRASYVPGHEPGPGGHLTDCSVGRPEWKGPTVSSLLTQLSITYDKGATAKDCPVEAFTPQSLSRAPCILVIGEECSPEHRALKHGTGLSA